MAVPSDGSYGIPEGLIFSFPVEINNKEWKIVQGLELDDFAKSKIKLTTEELVSERDEALQACEAANI
jgi:malate dehydrogenase